MLNLNGFVWVRSSTWSLERRWGSSGAAARHVQNARIKSGSGGFGRVEGAMGEPHELYHARCGGICQGILEAHHVG